MEYNLNKKIPQGGAVMKQMESSIREIIERIASEYGDPRGASQIWESIPQKFKTAFLAKIFAISSLMGMSVLAFINPFRNVDNVLLASPLLVEEIVKLYYESGGDVEVMEAMLNDEYEGGNLDMFDIARINDDLVQACARIVMSN